MTFMEECAEVIERFPEMARDLFYIRTQEEGFQRFNQNPVQANYWRDRVRRGFGSRDIVLKDRRIGLTTEKVLEILALLLFGPRGVGAAIVVHEAATAARVFKIFEWAYQRLPLDIRNRRPKDEDRREAVEIDGSTCYVYTAGSRGVARSETIHFALLDEVAWWQDPEGALPGIMDAIPRNGHVCQVSTPNGRDNYFYDACMAAKNATSANRLYFYEWWWNELNSLSLEENEKIEPTEEEYQLAQIARAGGFELTPEQFKWRRWKLADPATERTFKQEHPEDIETCFLVSGSPLFDPEVMTRLVRNAEANPPIQKLWMPDQGEHFIWRRPIGKYPFITAVDVAQGKSHGDWSVVSNWQDTPMALSNLSRIKVRTNTDNLTEIVIREAQKHQNSLVIIEKNSIGDEVVRKVAERGYWNQYMRLDREDRMFETEHPGWQTTQRSKSTMVNEFVDAVNANSLESFDTEVWGQAMNLSRDEYGRPVFPVKKHDDVVVTAMIANMARDQARNRHSSGASVVSYA